MTKTDETWVTIPEEEQAAAGLNFGDKTIRRGFIRKVYSILSLQLILTGAMIAYFVFLLPQHVQYPQCQEMEERHLQENYEHYADDSSNISSTKAFDVDKCNKMMFAIQYKWILFVCFGLALVIMIPMMCVKSLRTRFPINFLLLGAFTAVEAVSLGMVSMLYDVEAVLIAVGITTGIVLALTVFAFQTKWDFTAMGGILVCLLMGLMIFGIVMIFVPYSKYMQMVYGGAGAILFSFYLVYDTQMMMGGSHKYSISPEEYVFAALALYLDIINIFLYVLRFVGAVRSD